MIEKKDWRIRNQEEYLLNKKLVHIKYQVKNEKWDHEHCEFCSEKFIEGSIGYSTLDGYYWICEECYNDFKYIFGWEFIIKE